MRILIAVDGSNSSHAGVEDCTKRLWPNGTEFKVVTAVDSYQLLPPLIDQQEAPLTNAGDLVSNYAEGLQSQFPACSASAEVLQGYVKDSLLECASKWPADLIVMGSHGHTGIAKILVGSVSTAVLHSAKCSVRIVRQAVEADATADSVVVAADASEPSKAAIQHILGRSWAPGTKFTCLNVLAPFGQVGIDADSQPSFDYDDSHLPLMRKQSQEMAQAAADELNSKLGPCADWKTVEGDPQEQILLVADELKANLIVIGSHGRNFLGRAVLGSVSDAVVSHAKCSVEVVKISQK